MKNETKPHATLSGKPELGTLYTKFNHKTLLFLGEEPIENMPKYIQKQWSNEASIYVFLDVGDNTIRYFPPSYDVFIYIKPLV